ncbi:molybdenum cofactor biosynthesis protein A [Phanerochaete sordida]|uniref:GTP 3',8-cyclase n=1 Tax=Phanerochaete sordida TaxID=48140 RepID=A0A9P3G7E1_9APHY|nr:molybdenum cofactor biosynthesis protein A [Phanerochaete sordida]
MLPGMILRAGSARTAFSRGLKTAAVTEQAYPVPLDQHLRARARIAQIDAEKGAVSPFLVDAFHRQHNYLRISLTERCNLRCFYCMPSEGVELSPNGHILTDEEVVRLATLFVRNGVTKIRLTGGEPTVRKGLIQIVGRLNALRQYGLQSIGITTNGIALHRKLPELVENGLTHLNLSLDTLDPFKFEIMTRRPGHEAVLRALETALASGLRSVKLNAVIIKGLNDHEVLDFVEMTRHKAISVRFIEFMPFTGNKWDKGKMVPSSELLSRIEEKYPGVTKTPDELNDTARNYVIPGHRGGFGFISSMSDHFCGTCNRLRLTADGQIKVCLFDPKEISLRDQMRQGATDEELQQTIGRAVQGKREKHAGMEDIDTVTNRPMILIGG